MGMMASVPRLLRGLVRGTEGTPEPCGECIRLTEEYERQKNRAETLSLDLEAIRRFSQPIAGECADGDGLIAAYQSRLDAEILRIELQSHQRAHSRR